MKSSRIIAVLFLVFVLASCASLTQSVPVKLNSPTSSPLLIPSTPAIAPPSTSQLTTTPLKLARTLTYPFPSGDANQLNAADCTSPQTRQITLCTESKAYQSARKLDELLNELDKEFPNGAWEPALNRLILSEEKWESDKQPYCEIATQKTIGGTIHTADFMNCINNQNQERINTLLWAVCFAPIEYSKCAPRKQGGEPFVMTAIPIATATPTP